MNIDGCGITLENALFPFLFPHGHGSYDGKITFFEYIKYRMEKMFTPFTLYKPYLLYMYDVRQSLQILKEISKTCLDKDIKQVKQQYPHMTEHDVLQHITKYNLPSSIQGTPRWHKSHLQDLLAMVEQFGMPQFFLTLTADETSSLRWEEVIQIEDIAKTIDPSMSWKDCLVQCATLFHARVQKFMHDVLLTGPKILGTINQYVIRYELQSRGSVHAHIILWMNAVDVE